MVLWGNRSSECGFPLASLLRSGKRQSSSMWNCQSRARYLRDKSSFTFLNVVCTCVSVPRMKPAWNEWGMFSNSHDVN